MVWQVMCRGVLCCSWNALDEPSAVLFCNDVMVGLKISRMLREPLDHRVGAMKSDNEVGWQWGVIIPLRQTRVVATVM